MQVAELLPSAMLEDEHAGNMSYALHDPDSIAQAIYISTKSTLERP